ncbi:uncharacterized protein KY384_001071 [Bacidia gigantensis]|uniref:uncharacterized protein n=1 Tax=Bacidia gigantensis TaxID=2732470 RepID=UPI001D0493D9|nr:uncharacterized protein KY384_001071 [Bacidia gigantensis]KAG8534227.1 hypothetical protein KY384_001071 [Bacidia gigantensis]
MGQTNGLCVHLARFCNPPLTSLQRNPRLRPYEFWPLVIESTVIAQHVSSVAIFVCSFVGIFQGRLHPVSVLGWGTISTILGWVLWDSWVGQAEKSKILMESSGGISKANGDATNGSALSSDNSTTAPTPSSHSNDSTTVGLGLTLTTSNLSTRRTPHHSRSQTSLSSIGISPALSDHVLANALTTVPAIKPPNTTRKEQRLTTMKSAFLIFCALLGLSPILKSLTESTTYDSIWAMATWLMCINIFFFDYSGDVHGVKFPASLSTNAALMASTVVQTAFEAHVLAGA